MRHKGTQSSNAQDKPDSESRDQAIDKPVHKFVWEWGFWAEHPIAILSLFLEAILLAPITDFPGGNPKKIWFISAGIWLLLGTAIYFVTAGIIAKMEGVEMLSASERDERDAQFREKLQSKINELGSHVDELKSNVEETKQKLSEQASRSLTDHQKQEILTALLPFAGQKILVHSQLTDSEGIRYGQQFIFLLQTAKWNVKSAMSTNIGDYNVVVGVAKDDNDQNKIPPAAKAFTNVLAKIGIISDPTRLLLGPKLSSGEIGLYIGMKPAQFK